MWFDVEEAERLAAGQRGLYLSELPDLARERGRCACGRKALRNGKCRVCNGAEWGRNGAAKRWPKRSAVHLGAEGR